MTKSQTAAMNMFLRLLFLHLEKLSLYCFIYITVFFAWYLIENAVIKHQLPYSDPK